MNNFEPRIYVACLSSYNNGILYGKWLSADQSAEAIREEINIMLKASLMSGAEEFSIHDYDDFGGLSLSENESIDTIVAIAVFIKEHGDAGVGLLEYHGNDLESAKQGMEEYCGAYSSEVDFARGLMEDCYEIPDYLVHYIDYEAFARDLFINDYFSVERGGQMHVFRYI